MKKFTPIDIQDLELKPFLRFFVADEFNKIFENKITNNLRVTPTQPPNL